jgi:hypothetical protein
MKNNIKTYGGMAITIIILIVSIIWGYATLGHQVADNAEMKPDVKLNTEHRLIFTEKVNNMADNIDQILKAVQK